MAHTKEVRLIHAEIMKCDNDPLEDALGHMQQQINDLLTDDPDWECARVSVFQYADGGAGASYILCTMILEKRGEAPA